MGTYVYTILYKKKGPSEEDQYSVCFSTPTNHSVIQKPQRITFQVTNMSARGKIRNRLSFYDFQNRPSQQFSVMYMCALALVQSKVIIPRFYTNRLNVPFCWQSAVEQDELCKLPIRGSGTVRASIIQESSAIQLP